MVYAGTNVESVSFPVGTCAERNAIGAAVLSEGPATKIVRLALIAYHRGKHVPCSPCGACRQAILEFGQHIEVIYYGPELELMREMASGLLPDAFKYG